MKRSVVQSLGLFIAITLTVGCSKSNPLAPATVSGAIAYKGQPIKAGNLRFHHNGTAYPATISSDGTYVASDLPEGELIVTLETEYLNKTLTNKGTGAETRMKMDSGRKPPPGVAVEPELPSGGYTKIPSKYTNPKTSTFTVTLRQGRQVINIDFTD
jgi:hypothetical protein